MLVSQSCTMAMEKMSKRKQIYLVLGRLTFCEDGGFAGFEGRGWDGEDELVAGRRGCG